MDATVEEWDDPRFETVLKNYQERFKATNTEEGQVMSAVLAYVADESYRSRRGAILAEFRASERIQRLLERGLAQLEIAAAR
jgi:hypothetical protein